MDKVATHSDKVAPHSDKVASHSDKVVPHLDTVAPHLDKVAPHLVKVAPHNLCNVFFSYTYESTSCVHNESPFLAPCKLETLIRSKKCLSHIRQGAVAEAEEIDVPLVQSIVILELEGKPELLRIRPHQPREVSHQPRIGSAAVFESIIDPATR